MAAKPGKVKSFLRRLVGKEEPKGGDTSCGVGGCSSEKLEEKRGKNRKRELLKTVTYAEKKSDPVKSNVTAGHNTIKTDAIKGKVFDGTTKDFSGEDKTKSYGGGNEGEGHVSKEKHTRYYKERSRIGKAITNEKYKQKGGKIENQTSDQGKESKIETLVYKGAGRKARKGYEGGTLTDSYKEDYDIAKKKDDADSKVEASKLISGRFDPKAPKTEYVTKRSRGTDADYTIGGLEKSKQILGSKEAFKREIGNTYKKYRGNKKTLSKLNTKYGK